MNGTGCHEPVVQERTPQVSRLRNFRHATMQQCLGRDPGPRLHRIVPTALPAGATRSGPGQIHVPETGGKSPRDELACSSPRWPVPFRGDAVRRRVGRGECRPGIPDAGHDHPCGTDNRFPRNSAAVIRVAFVPVRQPPCIALFPRASYSAALKPCNGSGAVPAGAWRTLSFKRRSVKVPGMKRLASSGNSGSRKAGWRYPSAMALSLQAPCGTWT